MNAWLVAVTALITVSAASASSATEVVPAWQEPGFVMEEIVVTARVEQAVIPAWQQADFVMEEVVVIATAEDVANAWREQMHRRARILVAQLAREESAQ